MGANEENGKRNLKSGTPKKPFIYYYFLVILVVMVLNALVFPMMEHSVEVPYSEFLKELDAGNVKDVYVSNGESQIQFTKKDQKQWNVSYKTGPIPGDDLVGCGELYRGNPDQGFTALKLPDVLGGAHSDVYCHWKHHGPYAFQADGRQQRHDLRKVQCKDIC